jgi:hypothetical protein
MPKNRPLIRTDGYQQALEEFAIAKRCCEAQIANLLTQLQNYSDGDSKAGWMNLTQPELESLAAIFIRQLTSNLNGKAIAGYLNAMRTSSANIPQGLVHLAVPPLSLDLPANFPNVETPRYSDGDKLRWISDDDNTDWGVVSGRFYSFAPHQLTWTWCYLIWLDKNSPSANRVVADIAWEHDIEPIDEEKAS